MKKGVLKRSGSRGNYRYALQGRALDLDATQKLVELFLARGGRVRPPELAPDDDDGAFFKGSEVVPISSW